MKEVRVKSVSVLVGSRIVKYNRMKVQAVSREPVAKFLLLM
jgi:hypothetical protein